MIHSPAGTTPVSGLHLHDDPAPVQLVSRRSLLRGAAAGGLTIAVAGLVQTPIGASAAPALIRRARPELTHGVQSGDVAGTYGTVWTRAEKPSRMIVEYATRPDFKHSDVLRGPLLAPPSDGTGKVTLRGLPRGDDIYYRIWAEDLDKHGLRSAPLSGHFRTVPSDRRDVTFLWSGDLGGQGWGINPDIGGYRIFKAMHDLDPDFYICNGDNVYADGPITATVALPDGTTWNNITTEEKSKVAETLDEYRGQHKYNLLDDNLRRFYANTPQIQQWDDHETVNNWYPGEILVDDRYTEKSVDVLKGRAQQAWHEYTPIAKKYDERNRIYRVLHQGPLLDVFVLDMRWYRDANSQNRQEFNNGGILGYEQAEWLKRELAKSRATWKIISSDMPLSIVVADGTDYEAVANNDPGLPLGRELQIADILRFIKHRHIKNVHWITTDVHYTAAHYFDPNQATFQDFDPFWEFTSGPLNAGSFPAGANDTTFGSQRMFVKSPTTANVAPNTEYQFFGEITIDGHSRELTANLRDNTSTILWSTTLDPA